MKEFIDKENKIHKVTSVYSGIAGKCCCGCSGKHFDDDRNINRIIKILIEHKDDYEIDLGNISVEVGTRLYVAYFE